MFTSYRLIGVMVICVALQAFAQDPVHRRFTMADGLASNTVYRVTQDHRGFLWFSTDAGVSRFDGKHFLNFGRRQGLPDEEVLNAYEDGHHRLWLMMLNGRLAYIRNDSVFHPGNDPALAMVKGRSGWGMACEDRQGNIWFGGVWAELTYLDTAGVFHSVDLGALGIKGGIVAPMLTTSGELLVQVGCEGFRCVNGRLEHTLKVTPPEHYGVYARSADGRLWAAIPEGLQQLGTGARDTLPLTMRYGPWQRPRHLALPPDGSLIYTRWDMGAQIVDTASGESRHVFAEHTINHVSVDDEGDCWLTTAGQGAITFSLDQIGSRLINRPGGKHIEGVCLLHEDRTGRIWAGTLDGLIFRVDDPGSPPIDLRVGDMRAQKVRAMADDGRILIVATDVTTVRMPLSGGAAPVPFSNGPPEGNGPPRPAPKKRLVMLPNGAVVSAFYDLTRCEDPKVPVFLPWHANAFGKGRFHFMQVDQQGAVWLQRNELLYRCGNGFIDTLHFLQPYTTAHITGMGTFSDGTRVLGTLGLGLLLLPGGEQVVRFLEADGLLSDRCEGMCVRGDTVAIASAFGGQVLTYDATARSLHVVRTVHGPEARDVLLRGNALYLATEQGVVRCGIDPPTITAAPPRLYIGSITSKGHAYPTDREFILDADHRALDVAIAAVSLQPSTTMDLQYRIDASGSWTNSSTHLITLLLQDPGEYVLEVRARIPGSDWSPTLSLPFALYPPFWKRNLFRVPLAAVILLLCFQALRILARRRYFRRLQDMKQREVLSAERERIAMDLHDDLGADLSGTMMLAEAALHNGRDPHAALQQAITHVRALIPKVDEIVWALDGRNDSLVSLVSFLGRSLAGKAAAMGVRFEFVGPWNLVDRELSPDFRRDVLLIVKEAVNNALKHAKCDLLEVIVQVEHDEFRIEIRDNGRGILESGVGFGRHGLTNMQARARQAGGSVSFCASEPRGTCVQIKLPLPEVEWATADRPKDQRIK